MLQIHWEDNTETHRITNSHLKYQNIDKQFFDFWMDSKPKEIKLHSEKKNVPVRRFSYDNILDSDPHIMSKQF